jgi:hypothetical protein
MSAVPKLARTVTHCVWNKDVEAVVKRQVENVVAPVYQIALFDNALERVRAKGACVVLDLFHGERSNHSNIV